MTATSKPFLTLTAADLMSPAVMTIPRDMSLRQAAHMLAQADVSGAPVTNAEGHCVGVISARDFVSWAERGEGASRKDSGSVGCVCSAWQIVSNESLPEDVVANYMTANPVTVAPGILIGTLAKMMIDAHIHRVIVLDNMRRPIGVVSSTDVLAAVARAAQVSGDAAGHAAEGLGGPAQPLHTTSH